MQCDLNDGLHSALVFELLKDAHLWDVAGDNLRGASILSEATFVNDRLDLIGLVGLNTQQLVDLIIKV